MKAASYKIRIVTAASLFDGHDAAINIMRRILQAKGAEIIHLGHNRSALEIVEAAIEEDAQALAITSYQGGHLEFFKYIKDLLEQNGCGHIKIFGGGGGTILPQEQKELEAYGIERIYSPDDGRELGLEGMIDDLLNRCMKNEEAFWQASYQWVQPLTLHKTKDIRKIARAITQSEYGEVPALAIEKNVEKETISNTSTKKGLYKEQNDVLNIVTLLPEKKLTTHTPSVVLGITGTGGAGKSSVTDEIVRRFLNTFHNKTIAVISVDPSKKKTGGALLGDRIRMNSITHERAYMRSMATRNDNSSVSTSMSHAVNICKNFAFDCIILESAGVGQSDTSILDYCDVSLYVMTPEYGAPSQLEKINMLDYADVVCINKFDKAGALDALHDVRKQYKRNHALFNTADDELPIVGTCANTFNDAGVNRLFEVLLQTIQQKCNISFGTYHPSSVTTSSHTAIIPSKRIRYLSEIAEANRTYNQWVEQQSHIASEWYCLKNTENILPQQSELLQALHNCINEKEKQLHAHCRQLLEQWPQLAEQYKKDYLEYSVRHKHVQQPLFTTSLSGTRIPKVLLPKYKDWGDILKWQLQENVPGSFPFTAGVFPLKRNTEDPTRMFAGEGCPERTNKRFHYLSFEQPAKRLSTAFDSVTLYGESPDYRPDIFGKIGNSGVSVATVDDAKKLYSGFNLCHPATSVSMTINGPAPVLLAFFFNAAIDQQCELYIQQNGLVDEVEKIKQKKFAQIPAPVYYNPFYPERLPEGHNGLGLLLLGLTGDEVLPQETYENIKAHTLSQVRGTVQADILKEDQAQNTCIFSTEFALRLMGDVQEYFIQQKIQNFYSVSVSGYHIAEAGANPITQLAFTLANGFTYVEYYLSRGMKIDEFAPNLSFFFSNGMDAEYSVIGRVARRIWAKAMKEYYHSNERSQKLKYHIQTSGRSLHAQEIDFNDIRTTLQALYAIYDNCNSLHTNAYDEAITTPTEESVRRAMAIQLIINKELGSAKTENFIQGSFLIEELTDLVEEAVLSEFDRLTERGGVLGAMERMYQRNKIQEESMRYEVMKNTGELPIVGVNTFLNKSGSRTIIPKEVIRSSKEEKEQQIQNLHSFLQRNEPFRNQQLQQLKQTAVENGNLFAALMNTVKYCSLGEITHALYEVGGQYRRNM